MAKSGGPSLVGVKEFGEREELGGMGGRRVRRFSSTRNHSTNNSLLPIRSRTQDHQNTISCWYCDMKFTYLNSFFFSFGLKHSNMLKIWFSIGTGFAFTALLGVTLILLWELVSVIHHPHLFYNSSSNDWIPSRFLFGFLPSPLFRGFSRMSVMDGGYIILSTLISVAVHEFGHAIAAASEGIQIEYIAVYLAVLFPGALVAFNYDLLQSLPQYITLRVYCAGIWHNAVSCAACALALFLLPFMLFPFYIYRQNPVVLNVTSGSALSGYLSPGDVIVSLDGSQVHDPQAWMEKLTVMNEQALQNSYHSQDPNNVNVVSGRKGYCTPSSWVKNQKKIQLEDGQSSCPDGLTLFSNFPCLDDRNSDDGPQNSTRYCLNAREVVQLNKCGDGWVASGASGNSCLCLEDESCVMPVLTPGLIWVEIMYRRPYSSECLWAENNSSLDFGGPDSGATTCGGTFVFIGHGLSVENSVHLTAYRPRWGWTFTLGMNIPNMLEKLFAFTFHVSLTLALLNSLPVFLLDGESIVEVIVGYIPFLSPRKRAKAPQIWLLGGTLLSILSFSRVAITYL